MASFDLFSSLLILHVGVGTIAEGGGYKDHLTVLFFFFKSNSKLFVNNLGQRDRCLICNSENEWEHSSLSLSLSLYNISLTHSLSFTQTHTFSYSFDLFSLQLLSIVVQNWKMLGFFHAPNNSEFTLVKLIFRPWPLTPLLPLNPL